MPGPDGGGMMNEPLVNGLPASQYYAQFAHATTKAGVASTGHGTGDESAGAGPGNLFFGAGDQSPDDLIASVERAARSGLFPRWGSFTRAIFR